METEQHTFRFLFGRLVVALACSVCFSSSFAGVDEPKAGPRGRHITQGWYRIVTKGGRQKTVKVVAGMGGNLLTLDRGVRTPISIAQLERIESLEEFAARTGNVQLAPALERHLRDSVEALATAPPSPSSVKAYASLRRAFPDVRPLLHEALVHQAKRVRRLAAKLLGEKGSIERDLSALNGLLYDPDGSVRLAALRATEKLGGASPATMLRYLESEKVPNYRKKALEFLRRSDDQEALPALVRFLSREKDPRVRRHIVRALEGLTGKRLGDNVARWNEFLGGKR